jgi:hypothetical protein
MVEYPQAAMTQVIVSSSQNDRSFFSSFERQPQSLDARFRPNAEPMTRIGNGTATPPLPSTTMPSPADTAYSGALDRAGYFPIACDHRH